MEVAPFVLAYAPPPPARVLEIGCGSGELARALAAARYDVVAIDPDAPTGELFRRTSFEAFAEPGPFDAVVASRSLHHLPDLGEALDKVVSLLRSHGVIVLNEFAWDRLDEPTARWYFDRLGEPIHDWQTRWEEEHAGLHTSVAMRRELNRRFRTRHFAWIPYLYRDPEANVSETEEEELIAAGTIAATGFRYVGEAA